MKELTLTVRPTPTILHVAGAACRVWLGTNSEASGTVQMYVKCLAAPLDTPILELVHKHLLAVEKPAITTLAELLQEVDPLEATAALLVWEGLTAEQRFNAKSVAAKLIEEQPKGGAQ